MSLRVVGAGLGRTGTMSLKLALQRLLGEPCYHMVDVFEHPEHVPYWHQAALGNMPDWNALFTGYGAAVDWPASAFWHELSEANPDALILLSTRSAESWWKSASSTIFRFRDLDPDSAERKEWRAMMEAVTESTFTTEIHNREACMAAFERHNDHVRRTAPKDRLLEWTAKDGWEPICKMLDLPVPEEPFPFVNTTEEFIQRVSSQ